MFADVRGYSGKVVHTASYCPLSFIFKTKCSSSYVIRNLQNIIQGYVFRISLCWGNDETCGLNRQNIFLYKHWTVLVNEPVYTRSRFTSDLIPFTQMLCSHCTVNCMRRCCSLNVCIVHRDFIEHTMAILMNVCVQCIQSVPNLNYRDYFDKWNRKSLGWRSLFECRKTLFLASHLIY